MKLKHFQRLQRTGKIPGTRETSTTQTRAYAERYKGVTVEFQMKPGTTAALRSIGVSDGTADIAERYPELSREDAGWDKKYARFNKVSKLLLH